MTIAQYVAQYTAFLNAVLSMGPDIPEMLACLQRIRDESMKLVQIATRRFGFSAASPETTPPDETQWKKICEVNEVALLEESVVEKAQEHALKGAGPKGAIGDGALLRTLFEFLISNPTIMNWFLALLMKKA